ncbi:unnamed protein product [Pleuronectes platessa]|uniref:Uncharacterized protein n=1 Tax=Pleuronectes platessa TaxID=8262 RepID=A0A9N7Z0U1_PLEPL|nr:unnamed protein product [Pleuronectes platessa]
MEIVAIAAALRPDLHRTRKPSVQDPWRGAAHVNSTIVLQGGGKEAPGFPWRCAPRRFRVLCKPGINPELQWCSPAVGAVGAVGAGAGAAAASFHPVESMFRGVPGVSALTIGHLRCLTGSSSELTRSIGPAPSAPSPRGEGGER